MYSNSNKYLKLNWLVCLLLCFIATGVKGQQFNDIRRVEVFINQDTIKLDSLSIIPNSVSVGDSLGNAIDTSFYKIDFFKSLIIFNLTDSITYQTFVNKGIKISYRCFPYYLPFSLQHKSTKIINNNYLLTNPETFVPIEIQNSTSIFSKDKELDKKGSISRGISFGNNQDVNLNSGLNLQLSGNIGNDIQILAAITDQNIPIQPDGNTQQLQEFDKVFIQISKRKTCLLAGDFELISTPDNFIKFNKKAQGLKVSSLINLPDSFGKIYTSQSLSLSKGRFSRNMFMGIEGNQGPYKLNGAENESYIVIIAGTERVYIDGILLVRGADNDYTIDYNLSEIRFTPKQMMTKDKRIVVEFEYTDKSYARTIVNSSNSLKIKSYSWNINFFSEQDLKNQPIQQNLSQQKMEFLAEIGDSINNAFFQSVDSVNFNDDMVLYKKIDTLINQDLYKNIFVYYTNSDSAKYRLNFSFVGIGKGNYILNKSFVNGRIYQWVAPKNGVLQGDYEPVVLLITPKRKSMLSVSMELPVNKSTKTALELCMSENNKNLFSSIDKADDIGFAASYTLENKKKIRSNSTNPYFFVTKFSHQSTDKNFSYIERFREQEFERDWNINNNINKSDEHLSTLSMSVLKQQFTLTKYQISSYFNGIGYQGLQNLVQTDLNKRQWNFKFTGAHTLSNNIGINGSFFKNNATLSKKISFLIIGIGEKIELNSLYDINNNILTNNSFKFYEYEAFCRSSDTNNISFQLSYNYRFDYLPLNNKINPFSKADNINFKIGLFQSLKNQLNFGSTFRLINYVDTIVNNKNSDFNVLGFIEHQANWFKGFIKLSSIYQFGNGLEAKKEFVYVEVPIGQGLYSWTDYNGNGVKELDEFEIAAFRDLAKYIRVYITGSDFISVRNNQLNQTLSLSAKNLIKKPNNILSKVVSKLSTLSVLRFDNKSTIDDYFNAYNPYNFTFLDSSLIATSRYIRNSLFFNRNNSNYSIELSNQQNHNKVLLVNGFDERFYELNSIRFRCGLRNILSMNINANNGFKNSNSQVYLNKNYHIIFWDFEPSITIQQNKTFRYVYTFKYSEKTNNYESANDKSFIRSNIFEVKYNVLSKINILARYNLMYILFNSNENTPLAFEMLEGYKIGWNQSWNFSYMQTIGNNLQCNFVYEGRKMLNSNIVHIGSIQLRAYF